MCWQSSLKSHAFCRLSCVQPTPLHELYENSKGAARRCAIAQAVESQRQQQCTFAPNLAKPGIVQASPPEAKLSLSASVSRTLA